MTTLMAIIVLDMRELDNRLVDVGRRDDAASARGEDVDALVEWAVGLSLTGVVMEVSP